MTSNMPRWVNYGLALAAIVCSVISLFALARMDGPRWTTALNILSLVLIFLAVKSRGHQAGS